MCPVLRREQQVKLIGWVVWVVFCVFPAPAFGVGTPAGTPINNTATVSFEVNGAAQPPQSAGTSFTVLEVINVVLTQYGASVPVNSPDSNDALTFVLANTGNGFEPFSLTRNNAIGGDSYDPANGSAGSIYFESGTQLGFQTSGPNADTLYIPGANDPNLAADQSRIVYVVSDTPGSLATGATGIVRLTAASLTPGAAAAPPGTGLPGQGDGGIEAVVGTGQANREGTYIVSGLTVSVAKTVVSIADSRGGASFEPGATITYRVVVTLSGSGTAANLAVNDPLPAELNYVPGSITVGGATRTDGLDADNASFSAGTVSVSFGNSNGPAALPAIEFRATLN
jgi:uncharacterized repeat protein (TIGR01451 family)